MPMPRRANTKCALCEKPLYRRPSEIARSRYVACRACSGEAQKKFGITDKQQAGLDAGRIGFQKKEKFDFTYLSFGAGVQSTALLILANLGVEGVPKIDVAIFADTQAEPRWVYRHLWRMAKWSKIPIHICTAGNLNTIKAKEKGVTGLFSVPAFTAARDGTRRNGILMRQCTSQYKIQPIQQYVRAMLGYGTYSNVKHYVRSLHGISIDEVYRMKPSRIPWLEVEYPLVDLGMDREACLQLFRKHFPKLPLPRRSACVFCPYKSDKEWKELIEVEPRSFEKACKADDKLRRAIHTPNPSGIKYEPYIHKSLVPLRDVVFSDSARDSFGSECEGMCGV